jgi:hypothetical protein
VITVAPTPSDDDLLAELAAALAEVSGRAESAAAIGRAAFTWRTVDADLVSAELTFDSALDGAGVRGGQPQGRFLEFRSEPLSVDVEILGDRLHGQLHPPQEGTAVIESANGVTLSLPVDQLGFFVVENPPAGPVRLRCETSRSRLVTGWFNLVEG